MFTSRGRFDSAGGFAAVKAAMESTYQCLGINCADVGVYTGTTQCLDPVASSSCDVCRGKIFEGHCGAFSQEAKGKWDDWTYFSLVEPDCISDVCCCLLYTSPSPRDQRGSRMPSSA